MSLRSGGGGDRHGQKHGGRTAAEQLSVGYLSVVTPDVPVRADDSMEATVWSRIGRFGMSTLVASTSAAARSASVRG